MPKTDMNLDTWMTYAFACAVLSLIPGPSVLLIVGQALTRGMRAAVFCLAGETLGSSCLILLSLLGVGTILATSATLFVIVKWLGVAYLAYLGVLQLKEANRQEDSVSIEQSESQRYKYGSFSAGFITALLNPKAIIFYVAFIAQFFDPERSHLIQHAILIVTSAVVAGSILSGYALAAYRAQKALESRKARRNINYASGGFYLSGSILMATNR